MSKNLEAFTSSSLRGKKRGIYQQLLASLLAKVVKTNDPLEKIQALCEVAYTSRIKDKLDMDLIDVCYDVCRSFQNSKKQRMQGGSYITVSWIFQGTEENWKKYIISWQKQSILYYPWFTSLRKELFTADTNFTYEYNQLIANKMRTLPEVERFFQKTTVLLIGAFYALQGEFTNWVLKQLLEIQSILSDEIDPKVWSEALGLKGEPEEKTVDGDQMDSGQRQNQF